MLTTSKTISMFILAIFFSILFANAALATELLFNVQGTSVRVVTDGNKVTANDEGKRKTYFVSNSFADHLKKSFEVNLINTYNDTNQPIFFILTREPSKPDSMGRGYCGAGYEDFLLLIKLYKKTFRLNDKYLLQSCLQTKSMRIEHSGVNPQEALRLNTDGSYTFEMIDDDYQKMWNLRISQGKFIIKNISENIPR